MDLGFWSQIRTGKKHFFFMRIVFFFFGYLLNPDVVDKWASCVARDNFYSQGKDRKMKKANIAHTAFSVDFLFLFFFFWNTKRTLIWTLYKKIKKWGDGIILLIFFFGTIHFCWFPVVDALSLIQRASHRAKYWRWWRWWNDRWSVGTLYLF